MTAPEQPDEPTEGVRERKRRETRARITEAGLKLFTSNGFEATTLDVIAAEAGISRRTVFHYFKSKDDILLSLQAGLGERLAAALTGQSPTQSPLVAARKALLSVIAPFDSLNLIAIDRLMRSSEAVQERKQASYIGDERVLFTALRQQWPNENETVLRLVATLTINTTRLSLDAWSADGGTRPLTGYIEQTFDALKSLFRGQ